MGIDLSIAIRCECNPCGDWMAFASWYSIRKRMPDCVVSVETILNFPMFKWANKFGVKILKNSPAKVKIPATVMVVRDFSGDFNISSSKSSDQTAFVDYKDGCGNFVVDEWINTSKVPFEHALRRFGSYNNLTVNEMAVLTFWEKCHLLYQSLGVT